MSNTIKTNPMVIDSTGTCFTAEWHFSGIQVVPSAGNSVVVLKDKNNNEIYRSAKASADSYSENIYPILVEGLKVDTLTNITKILVRKRNT
jgi:hypothetical protein